MIKHCSEINYVILNKMTQVYHQGVCIDAREQLGAVMASAHLIRTIQTFKRENNCRS